MEPTLEGALPCYSARLLKPFAAVLAARADIPKPVLRWLAELGPDTRLRVSAVHQLLEAAVALTGDESLGLEACSQTSRGDVGVFDFLLSSAESVGAALESAIRYMPLLGDTLAISLEQDDERVFVAVASQVVLPAAAEDFQLCGLIGNHAASWPDGMMETLEVWFCHAPPRDQAPYQRLLGAARLHFHAPRSGFSFPRAFMSAPLRSSDPKLHAILERHARATLAELPQPDSVTERVRRVVQEQLSSGELAQAETARQLGMSSRTLSRRLAEEGTTFRSLVDDARRRIAMRALVEEDDSVTAIAAAAGFYDGPSFFRAFRRWTGQTPRQYRIAHCDTVGRKRGRREETASQPVDADSAADITSRKSGTFVAVLPPSESASSARTRVMTGS